MGGVCEACVCVETGVGGGGSMCNFTEEYRNLKNTIVVDVQERQTE